MKDVAAISKSWFICPQELLDYLLHKLCMFLVGLWRTPCTSKEEQQQQPSRERNPQASWSIRQNTSAWSCSARLVADTRPAKLDLFLCQGQVFTPGWLHAWVPPSPRKQQHPLASCWPSSHHWLAGSGEESWDSDVSSFSRVHPIAWLMGSFCVMPCLCCWQRPPLTDVLTTGWKTSSTSGPKPDSILSVLVAILMDSGSMTSAHHYVVSCCSSLL